MHSTRHWIIDEIEYTFWCSTKEEEDSMKKSSLVIKFIRERNDIQCFQEEKKIVLNLVPFPFWNAIDANT